MTLILTKCKNNFRQASKLLSLGIILLSSTSFTQAELTREQQKVRHGVDCECADSILQNYFKSLKGTTQDDSLTGGTVRSDDLYGLWRICYKKHDSVVAEEIVNRLSYDLNPNVRRTAAELIPLLDKKYSGSGRFQNALQTAFHDPVIKVRLQAASSLFTIGQVNIADANEITDTIITIAQGKAVFPLIVNKKCPTCERNGIFHLRRNAIAILKKINNEKARMTLQELINDPDSAVANYMVKTLKHNDYKK